MVSPPSTRARAIDAVIGEEMKAAYHPGHDYAAASGDLEHDQLHGERVWAKAIIAS